MTSEIPRRRGVPAVFEIRTASIGFVAGAVNIAIQMFEPSNKGLQTACVGLGSLTLARLVYNKENYWKKFLPAAFIGSVFGGGYRLYVESDQYWNFGAYLMSLSTFHITEYLMTAMWNAHTLSFDSFLLNHSRDYQIAASVSWVEYFLEKALNTYHFPYTPLATKIGLGLVIFGDLTRKIAMHTAGSNFTHQVAYSKVKEHELVTTGIYSIVRHPSYFGWFWWSVGTQVLLVNPLCTVAYAAAAWVFFNSRLEDEEECLIDFFGDDYRTYKKKVPSGIPFIP